MLVRERFVAWLGWALVVAAAARVVAAEPPAPIAASLAALVSADAAQQRAAVEALAATGDRNVIPALEALREGSLYVWPQPDGSRPVVIAREKTEVNGQESYLLQQAYGGDRLIGA